MIKAYAGYLERDGRFIADEPNVELPARVRVIVNILNDEFFESDATCHDECSLLGLVKSRGIPNVTLPADENGHAFIDKEKHPNLYDWAVNG